MVNEYISAIAEAIEKEPRLAQALSYQMRTVHLELQPGAVEDEVAVLERAGTALGELQPALTTLGKELKRWSFRFW